MIKLLGTVRFTVNLEKQADTVKGVAVEILVIRSLFMVISVLSAVNYPHKRVKTINYKNFEKSKKHYVCVLKFCQKWFS